MGDVKAKSRLCVLGCAVIWLATGCQHVMWYGYDATRFTPVTILSRCGEQFVEVGDREHESFDAVAIETLSLSQSGRVAYAALDGTDWYLVVDGLAIGMPLLAWRTWAGRWRPTR